MRPKALVVLLNSVKIQSLYPNEVIIVDGSTNSLTKEILEINNFKNLLYYKVDDSERGLTRQRNKGISLLDKQSEIVCFLDDDTILEEDYFEKLLSTYLEFPEALAVCGYISNAIEWRKTNIPPNKNEFTLDGYTRNEGSRYQMRKFFGLLDDTPPGFMPSFSNGRPISFIPPSGKTYRIEQMMGGVSSYKKKVFEDFTFSTYFEGYGLYEDADFSLRLSKTGSLFVNTLAKLEHHHDESGRPNKFEYGKMVVRNGWYVWRVKYESPALKARFKWNSLMLLYIVIRFVNVITTKKRRESFTEASGRLVGLINLIFSKPKVQR